MPRHIHDGVRPYNIVSGDVRREWVDARWVTLGRGRTCMGGDAHGGGGGGGGYIFGGEGHLCGRRGIGGRAEEPRKPPRGGSAVGDGVDGGGAAVCVDCPTSKWTSHVPRWRQRKTDGAANARLQPGGARSGRGGRKGGGGRMEGRERVEKGERKGDGKGDVEREGKKATPTAQLSLSLSLSLSPHSHTARTFQSAASMTATSSRPASAHIASCSAALVTRTHTATLSPPAPYTAAPLRVTTRNPVLPRGNAWRLGAGEGGRRGRTRGRRGEVER
ncbi:unnamed protein product [Closterium sp. Naga37s-1]|nr:unnamed protein product [Closterium sp. Naga37s-1]